MPMSEESLKNGLKNLLQDIYVVSNKDYQRRVWINGIGPECDDFDETSESILNEGRSIIEAHKKCGMTEPQYLLLKKFIDQYEAFCDKPVLEYYLAEVFIDTPEWTKITELAQEVLTSSPR